MTQDTVLHAPVAGPEIRTVDAGRAVEWLASGFRLFMKHPGFWLIGGVAALVGVVLLNKLVSPLLAGPLLTVLFIVLTGAAMRACQALEQGRDPVADAKAALQLQPLWILGALGAGLSLMISAIGFVAGLAGIAVAVFSSSMVLGLAGVFFLLMFALSLVLGMALWLAPALVVIRGVEPVQAVKLSLAASLKNLVAYIVLAILAIVAIIIGRIPMFLGLLVVFPALMCSSFAAHKEVFSGP